MRLSAYLKDKWPAACCFLLSIATVEILLLAWPLSAAARIYVCAAPVLTRLLLLLTDYDKKKRFYDDALSKLQELDQKYLLSEVISSPTFAEGRILQELLEDTGRSMLEHVNEYKHAQEEYKDYIELWIHEIKTPIAAGKLLTENHPGETAKELQKEFDRIEAYTEQALYYARSSTAEKDYLIKRTSLHALVNAALRKNRAALLKSRTALILHDLDMEVFTDSKWLTFILGQLLQNAAKYAKAQDSRLEIFGTTSPQGVLLTLRDNGVGISESDLPRVFEKGFTGENGRLSGKKSTGLGLYLCKKLCEKLGLGLTLSSKQGVGTEARISFPLNSHVYF
ncbi:MAG: sensor histidine kinase [Eubacteriales bacterium]|nr:sensor histidine kinase [Eubacteriales bacterium]